MIVPQISIWPTDFADVAEKVNDLFYLRHQRDLRENSIYETLPNLLLNMAVGK